MNYFSNHNVFKLFLSLFKKIPIVMRITLLLFFVVLFQIRAESSYSQVTLISLNLKNSTLEEILSVIEEKSEFYFLYNTNLIDVDRKVDIDVKDKSVQLILNELFDNTDVTYYVDDRQIVLSSKDAMYSPMENESQATQQASRRLTGKVVDVNGEGVIGANVFLKGTEFRGITDVNGNFTFNIPADGGTLVVSFIGYVTQEIRITNQTSINVVLEEDLMTLEEVVVVGYGTQKKVNLTGAVAAVTINENISSRSVTNVSSGLSGLIPGLAVLQSTGFAGFDNASLQIRGITSVNSSSPLIVVDGMPDVNINRIDISDIESLSVLKDAASSAIYGSRAAAGVILITTKSGKNQDKAKINYTGSYGISDPSHFYEYLADYPRAMTMQRRAAASSNSSLIFKDGSIEQWLALGLVDPILFPNTNQYDDMFRQGSIQRHNISASGGSDKMNFFLSVGVTDQKGIQIHNDYQRYNFRLNGDYKMRSNISVGVRTDGSWTQTDYPRSAGLENAGLVYAVSGILNKHPVTGQYGGGMAYGENTSAGNMLAEYELYLSNRTQQEYNANVYGDWEIFKGLKFNIGYALKFYNQFNKGVQNIQSQWNFQTGLVSRTMPDNDGLSNSNTTGWKTMFSARLNYDKEIIRGHRLGLMAAASEEYWFERSLNLTRRNRLDPDLTEINAALDAPSSFGGSSSDEGLRSIIGRFNYSALDRYLIEANFRYDASSKFTPGNQWGFFPSVSVGWRISEEVFFSGLKDKITNLKLRASTGSLGNHAGVNRYDQKNTFSTTNYVLNGSMVQGFSSTKIIDPEFTWEKTSVKNIGLDLGFFKNRLTAELDYYDKLTTNMIRSGDLSTLLSAFSTPSINIGEMRMKGVEANINWKSRINKFNYGITFNVDYSQSRLEVWNQFLSKGWTFINMPYQFTYSMMAYPGLIQSWNDIYNAPYQGSYQYIAPGDILTRDLNGDGQVTSGEDKYAYDTNQRQRFSGNWGLTLFADYKGFDLTVLFQASTGRYDFWLDNFNNVHVPADRYGFQQFHWDDTWSLDNRGATMPRIVTGNTARNRDETSFWLYDVSYLRMKNLQFGYAIPKNLLRKISFDRIRIYATAENLLTFTKWPGVDPEKYYSNDAYPLVKSYTIGVNIGF